MYHTHRSLYDRPLEKTPEQVFVNTPKKEFELSAAESKGVLELAKECLFGEIPKRLGKVKVLCASLASIDFGRRRFSYHQQRHKLECGQYRLAVSVMFEKKVNSFAQSLDFHFILS